MNYWNSLHSVAEGVVLLPVKWETHATPEAGIRGQDVINRDLVNPCDILIGMFWTRIGTATGVAASGTVEEIDQFVNAGKPAMLYFSDRMVAPSKINSDQQQKLREFKAETYKNALCGSFVDVNDLKTALHKDLTNTVRRLRTASGKQTRDEESAALEAEQIKRAKSEHADFVKMVLAGNLNKFRGKRGIVTISIIPFAVPNAPLQFGRDFQQKHGDMFTPLETGHNTIVPVQDGILSLSVDRQDMDEPSLAKFTELGSIFSVDHWLKWDSTNDKDKNSVWDVPIYDYEGQIISAIYRYFHLLQSFVVTGPWWVSITLSNVRNLQITTAKNMHPLMRVNVLTDDTISGGCKVTTDIDLSSPNTVAPFIKPALDRIWHARLLVIGDQKEPAAPRLSTSPEVVNAHFDLIQLFNARRHGNIDQVVMTIWIPTCSGLSIILIISTGAMVVIAHRRRLRKNVTQWHRRRSLPDAEFLIACQMPNDDFTQRVALATRRAVASLGAVPAETILPEDSFAQELAGLPFWDSVDWLGFIFEVERQASNKIHISGSVVDGAVKLAGGYKEMRVRHVIRSVVASAYEVPFES